MNEYSYLSDQAVRLAAWYTVVPLAAASAAGLVVSVLQAVTQIQEQTLAFLVRLGVLAAVLWAGGPSACRGLSELVRLSFSALVTVGAGA